MTSSTAGYSGTPLVKKLGIKAGFRMHAIHPPSDYLELIEPIPEGVKILQRLGKNLDMIHFFSLERRELKNKIQQCMHAIHPAGMIWISWPKKASKVPTDITEDVIREVILPLGLVDIKVCAVDQVWSGLKLVIRKQLRAR